MIWRGHTAALLFLFSAKLSRISKRPSQHFDNSSFGFFWMSANSWGYVSIQFQIAFSREFISTVCADFFNKRNFCIVSTSIIILLTYNLKIKSIWSNKYSTLHVLDNDKLNNIYMGSINIHQLYIQLNTNLEIHKLEELIKFE